MKSPQNDEPQLNYEQLGEEAAKLNPQELDQAAAAISGAGGSSTGGGGAAAAPVNVAQICTLYRAVKRYLDLIVRIPFIPSSIITAIRTFTRAMNLLCP